MTEASQTVIISVFLMAALVLIQTVALSIVILKMASRFNTLEKHSNRLTDRVLNLLEQGEQILTKIASFREKLPLWEGNLTRTLDSLNSSVKDADQKSSRLLATLREKTQSGDQYAEQILAGFSRATDQVSRSVLSPAYHLSAAFSGIGSALNRLFRRGEEEHPRYYDSDGENFI